MKRPILAAAAVLFGATLFGASGDAQARGGYRGYYGDGIIGGLSANAIVGGYDYYGYAPGIVGDPGYPAPANYAAPGYPPPGCIIRSQRVFNGYAWSSRKIRVCY